MTGRALLVRSGRAAPPGRGYGPGNGDLRGPIGTVADVQVVVSKPLADAKLTVDGGDLTGTHASIVINSSGRIELIGLPRPAILARMGRRRVHIKSFGCQMNKLDTALVTAALTETGYALTDSVKDADVVVINTC